MKRIPSLDGLRAVSVALVMASHAGNKAGPAGPHWWHLILGNGGLGVSVFFVLSGYLITALLLRELETVGTISLSDFYRRRVLRIFPAYYSLIFCVAILGALGLVSLGASDILPPITFTTNYWPHQISWTLDHSWSLSVEEQFYLLWPGVLALSGRKRALRVAILLIVLAPFIRIAQHFWGGNLSAMLHTRIDTLMFGCAAALAGPSLADRARKLAPGYAIAAAVTAGLISPFLMDTFGGAYLYVFGYTLEGACIVTVMLWLAGRPDSVVGRLLNSRLAVHVGVISYSIYLWQQLFMSPGNHSPLGEFPLNVGLALIVAELSYRIIERPFLRFRPRARMEPAL
jgi:peptidoglycan/LPS O-acetylase OafA/YrhL